MDTLFLDPTTLDLVLDANRNIALASIPYALAQDAASAVRTFEGEVYYDTTQGVPYLTDILGERPPLELVRAAMVKAALTVPGVIAARMFVEDLAHRRLTGQVQVTDSEGVVTALNF